MPSARRSWARRACAECSRLERGRAARGIFVAVHIAVIDRDRAIAGGARRFSIGVSRRDWTTVAARHLRRRAARAFTAATASTLTARTPGLRNRMLPDLAPAPSPRSFARDARVRPRSRGRACRRKSWTGGALRKGSLFDVVSAHLSSTWHGLRRSLRPRVSGGRRGDASRCALRASAASGVPSCHGDRALSADQHAHGRSHGHSPSRCCRPLPVSRATRSCSSRPGSRLRRFSPARLRARTGPPPRSVLAKAVKF